MDRELDHHLEELVERLIEAGFTPKDARAEAARRFGDVERIRREVRAAGRARVPWIRLAAIAEGVLRDLRLATRSTVRSPWLALTVIFTLGVGIGANTAIFSVVEAVLLRAPPFPEPHRVAYVHEVTSDGRRFGIAPANFLDWKTRQTPFETIAVVAGARVVVSDGGPPERVAGVRVTSDYFRVLGAEPVLGRTFVEGEGDRQTENVAVVSHRFWVSRLARDPEAVGRTIRLNGAPHTVVGVMPEGLLAFRRWYTESPIDVWLTNPFAADPPTERQLRRLSAIARLAPGMTFERAQAEMRALGSAVAAEHADISEGWSAGLYPLPEALTESVRGPVFMLFGAVGFILLIACMNVGSLLLARADRRRGAMSLRRALGASRASIVRQLLCESLILSLAAGVLGVVVASLLLPVLVQVSPVSVVRIGLPRIDATVLAFSLLAATLATILTGLVPAAGLSSPNLTEELKAGGPGMTESRKARAGRGALVVAEIAMSVVLVVGSALMLQSYLRLTDLELGFEPRDVVRVGVVLARERYADRITTSSDDGSAPDVLWRPNAREIDFVEGVESGLGRLSGVEVVSGSNADPLPGWGFWAFPIRPQEAPRPAPGEEEWAMVRPITPGYFDVVEIPIVHGRGLEEADRAGGEDIAVIDEAAADRLWPGENPIGRSLLFQDGVVDRERPFRVVGVAAQARQAIWTGGGSVAPDDFPVVYMPYRRQAETYVDWQVAFRMRTIFLLLTERNVADIAPEIRQVVTSFDPELPISIQPLAETLRGPLSNQRFYTGMLSAFGALALLLATSGVFAVMAYTVSRKTRELGIRLALGAHGGQLQRVELWRGAKLAWLGLLIGGAGAAWLSRFITGFLHGLGTLDPATYGLVAGIVLGAVLLAGYLPARRAATVDPVRSLRTE